MASETIEADVAVVGAGFAGLAAALHLETSGKTVAVLEARPRVGGRTWTERRPSGAAVDRGGAWLSPRHDAARRLAGQMGSTTYKTYVEGSHLLVGPDRTRRYTGLIPKISPLAVAQIAVAQLRLDRMARQVPVEAPWQGRRAQQWDAQDVGTWLETHRIRSRTGHALFDMAVRGLFAAPDMHQVSFLNLLLLVHAHEKIEALFSIEGGAQENLVDGGLGALAESTAASLAVPVHLSTPVRSITQGGDKVEVVSDRVVVTARHAVVSVPPALALGIAYEPALPDDRRQLYRQAVAGVETKTLAVYDSPFWRSAGFSGQSAEPGSLAEVTIDSSPRHGEYGVLACFTFGDVARQAGSLDPGERRRGVLEALAARFGSAARTPADYVETSWWDEPWTKGCSMAHFPPGLLTRHGRLLREPFGRLFFAGTETATISYGAVDGAIRSGQRAAEQILG